MRQVHAFALLLAVLFVMIHLRPGFGDTGGNLPVTALTSPRATGFARDNPLKSKQMESPESSVHVRKASLQGGKTSKSIIGVWIEAEEETAFRITSPNSGERSSLHHFGASYWSLSGGGDWVEYSIEVPEEQMLYIWVRHSYNLGHPGHRARLRISMNGITMSTIPDYPGQGSGAWAWSRVGWGHMVKDRHKLRITKDQSTEGCALIDALYITSKGDAQPPVLPSRGASSG